MEIKLITTDVTTSGRGVGFKFLGNIEIKKGPTIFGTTVNPNESVSFLINDNTSDATSNDENYFELYRDANEEIAKFVLMSPKNLTALNFF